LKRKEAVKMDRVELSTGSLALVLALLAILGGAIVYAVISRQWRIQTVGTVKTVGLQVKDDYGNLLTSIDWGTLTPDSSKDFHAFVINNGSVPITLTLATENWNPSEAQHYIELTWDYLGEPINPGASQPIIFTLTVYPNITGISTFNFDIVITAHGG
jgi:hypothetical protein